MSMSGLRAPRRWMRLFVATDDSRIYDAVSGFGGKVIMTPEFPTGTDRVAYVAERVKCDVVANIQGDEPLLEPVMLDQMIQPFHDNPEVRVSTLKQRVDNEADYRDVNVVKVVTDLDGFAQYFSRASIPGNLSDEWIEANPIYRHVGYYTLIGRSAYWLSQRGRVRRMRVRRVWSSCDSWNTA